MAGFPGLGGPSNTALRSNPILWILLLVQGAVAIIVLGITASSASQFGDLGCNVPSKLGYNIAVSVITLVALIYLIPATGPKHIAAIPWHQFISLGLTALLLILWVAAVGASVYTCSDLCNACKKQDIGCGLEVWIGGLYCSCLWGYDDPDQCTFDKRSVLEKAAAGVELKARSSPGARAAISGSRVAAKQSFDAIEMILFLGATVFTAFLIFQHHKSSTTTTNNNHYPNQPAAAPTMQQQQAPPMQNQAPPMQPGPDDKPGYYGGAPQNQYGAQAPPMQEQPHQQQYTGGVPPQGGPDPAYGQHYGQPT